MKILFLHPYPLGEAPSQRFRFEQYFQVLKENKFEIKTQSFWSLRVWFLLYKPGHFFQKFAGLISGLIRRFTMMLSIHSFDYVFIHRECSPLGPPVFEWLIAKVLNKKIIYDFDDSIWLPNTSAENKVVGFLKWHGKISSICTWSYKISCGNSYLAEYANQFNSNVVINPTTIDTIGLHYPDHQMKKEKTGLVTIGWTGTHSTLAYLTPLIPVFQKLTKKFPGQWRLLIIANKKADLSQEFAEFKYWAKETEIQDLLQFDIGIMPLVDDIWSKGKCGFKALQYMALEIPAIVSPVGVNIQIIENGVDGLWCSREPEWLKTLEALLLDKSLRKEIGKAGRKKVIKHYSVSSNSSNFLALFS